MSDGSSIQNSKIPLLLLKTKSQPSDTYEEYFRTFADSRFEPFFVPVLEHTFRTDAVDKLRCLILDGSFSAEKRHYGAIIVTSQRAVEALASVVNDIRQQQQRVPSSTLPTDLRIYVVGPATARAVRALNLEDCHVIGEEAGNGDVLADSILTDYNAAFPQVPKPPLHFLVGEKRRDVIPNKLQSQNLSSEQRLAVEELEVYGTGEMLSFKSNFAAIWGSRASAQEQWVVVFSPTGCKAMLECIGALQDGSARTRRDQNSTKVVTIGPTTRDYLKSTFDFEPDASAAKPSPEGIGDAIAPFINRHG